MKKQKIKVILALTAVGFTVSMAEPCIQSVYALTNTAQIQTVRSSASYGIASDAMNKLIEEGWVSAGTDSVSTNSGKFKFTNLRGVNGKDAVLSVRCDFEENDHYIIKALELMTGTDSSLTYNELATKIGNGSSTITDGSRLINVHYDGKIAYTLTITFYNYGFTPSYVMPSLDNKNVISTIENSINTGDMNVLNVGLGSTKESPLSLSLNDMSKESANSLFNDLSAEPDNINSVSVNSDADYTMLNVRFLKDDTEHANKYLNVSFKINNEYESAISSADSFYEQFKPEEVVPPVTEPPVVEPPTVEPPVVIPPTDNDTTEPPAITPPSTDDSDNNNPVIPPVTDDSDDGTTVPPVEDEEDTPPVVVPPTDNDTTEPPVVTPPAEDDSNKAEENTPPADDKNDTDVSLPVDDKINESINNAVNSGIVSVESNADNNLMLNFTNSNTASVQSVFDSFKSSAQNVEMIKNADYTIIRFNIKRNTMLLARAANADDYITVELKIKNEYTELTAIAENFVKELTENTESTPEVLPPTDDSQTPPSINPPVVVPPSVNPPSDYDKEDIIISDEDDKQDGQGSADNTTDTENSKDEDSVIQDKLPQTGTPFSLPFAAAAMITAGSLLKFRKKK